MFSFGVNTVYRDILAGVLFWLYSVGLGSISCRLRQKTAKQYLGIYVCCHELQLPLVTTAVDTQIPKVRQFMTPLIKNLILRQI